MQLIFKLKKYYYALVNVLVFYIHDPKKSSQQQYGLDTIIILVLQMRNLRFRVVGSLPETQLRHGQAEVRLSFTRAPASVL